MIRGKEMIYTIIAILAIAEAITFYIIGFQDGYKSALRNKENGVEKKPQ